MYSKRLLRQLPSARCRMVRYGALQCMVWQLEGTLTVGVLGFIADCNGLVYGAVDVYEFPGGIFDITDAKIAETVLNTCTGIGLDAIPAANIGTDNLHQFASYSEKTTWNAKANSNLDNVSLSKALDADGYYKAPDGMMFAWGAAAIRQPLSTCISRCRFTRSPTLSLLRLLPSETRPSKRLRQTRYRHPIL